MMMHAEVVEQFNRHEDRQDGAQVAGGLMGGLTVLRDSFYVCVRADVARMVGMDSMWLPASNQKAEESAKMEIEIYQIAESAAAAHEHQYVRTGSPWYSQWLTRLRLGESRADATVVDRLAHYGSRTPDDRRLAFTDVLAKAVAESARAPLVLFRLTPLAVWIATALAFGDHLTAADVRNRQVAVLPAIADCHQCHGEVLENGEQCPSCGNPLWKSDWLTEAG